MSELDRICAEIAATRSQQERERRDQQERSPAGLLAHRSAAFGRFRQSVRAAPSVHTTLRYVHMTPHSW